MAKPKERGNGTGTVYPRRRFERVTDGTRTRDLRSHNSREVVPARPDVSAESACLQVFREILASECPLRTGAYRSGCGTVAVNPFEQTQLADVPTMSDNRGVAGDRTRLRILLI